MDFIFSFSEKKYPIVKKTKSTKNIITIKIIISVEERRDDSLGHIQQQSLFKGGFMPTYKPLSGLK
jgi:hypothetical protein